MTTQKEFTFAVEVEIYYTESRERGRVMRHSTDWEIVTAYHSTAADRAIVKALKYAHANATFEKVNSVTATVRMKE